MQIISAVGYRRWLVCAVGNVDDLHLLFVAQSIVQAGDPPALPRYHVAQRVGRGTLLLMNRVRIILVITCTCLLLAFGYTWMFFGGKAFIFPILASLLTGLYVVIWLYSRQAPDDPGGVFWREEQRRRRRLGLCLKCGYDLTGNESGVCPECGSPITPDS